MSIEVKSEKQLAECLNLSVRTIQRLRVAGNGPQYIRLGERRIGYKLSDIEKWLDQNTHKHTAAELTTIH